MRIQISKDDWIKKYGGQALLDAEGFDVVECIECDDLICHGWRVQKRTSMKNLNDPVQVKEVDAAIEAEIEYTNAVRRAFPPKQ